MIGILNKLHRIIMSRLKSTETDKDWIQERKEICRKCPFNTDNITNKSFMDNVKLRANQVLNFILRRKVTEEATCTVCGCMLIFKTAEEEEYCPKNKWGKHYGTESN